MVAEEEARFHEGLRRVDSFWFFVGTGIGR